MPIDILCVKKNGILFSGSFIEVSVYLIRLIQKNGESVSIVMRALNSKLPKLSVECYSVHLLTLINYRSLIQNISDLSFTNRFFYRQTNQSWV